ncbi:transglutaminase domain-containing protein [Treponema pedis]|uniref:Transglutaminase-like domain-containing protein n=1 Tax=Treponema pedis TaxID=409322 RepID=A0A7S6WPW5_9SPIR|nr:hypothetical protein [Treponema pedis]QOW61135.1 hypothetical protein IFE08_01610 [Treponema pedis]
MKNMTIKPVFFLTGILCLASCDNRTALQVPGFIKNNGTASLQMQQVRRKETAPTYKKITDKAPDYLSSADSKKRKEILFERLLNACLRYEDDVYVGDLGISCSNDNPEHKRLYEEFLTFYPFVFHIIEDGGISINYKPQNNDELDKYKFIYKISKNSFEEKFKKFENTLERFYGVMQEGMDDAELSFVIYRELLKNTVYSDGSVHSSDALGALIDGKSICQGYGLSYRRLMNGIGIETEAVTGAMIGYPEGHMWNRIKLNGKWYNAEPTWDDNKAGNVYRQDDCLGRYFLTSDYKFHNELNHPYVFSEEYPELPAADDKKYDSDSPVFRNSDKKSNITYHNGYWYYFLDTDRSIYKSNFDGSEKKVLYVKEEISIKNPELHRLEFGTDRIYFIDYVKEHYYLQSENEKYRIYSMDYDGANLKEEKLLPEFRAPLKPESDKPLQKRSCVALRGEIALSKIKDAYFHGTENYFNPQAEQRKEFINTIKEAENLLTTEPSDGDKAALLYVKLQKMRKEYTMPQTCSP